jgi:hypothetical protein
MSGVLRRAARSLLLAAVLAGALATLARAGPSADVPVTTNSSLQIETSLAIAKDNTTIVAAFTDKRLSWGAGNCSFSRSSDAGLTWLSDDMPLPKITPIGGGPFHKSADPAVAYSAKDKTFNYLCLAGDKLNHRSAIVYEHSSDGGQTWSDPQILQQSDSVKCKSAKNVACSVDKDYLTVDNTPSSSHYGRIYATWTVADAQGHHGRIAESHLRRDVGSTHWSAVKLIGGANRRGFGPMIAAGGKNGSAYIGWCRNALATGADNCHDPNSAAILVSRSTSGGASWSQPSVAQTYLGVPGHPQYPYPQPEPFRINSFGTLSMNPSKHDDVRLVYSVWNGKDTDVMFTHADHAGGGSWSKPIDVGGGRDDQFFPWMVSLSDGSVWVCYYDEHYTKMVDISCNRSATGASFAPRTRVTDMSSPLGGFFGDYIGVAAGSDGKPAVLWTDFRTGKGDIYFGRP